MVKYLTDELELQSVADAIRAKGGTSESLAFPTGFVSAIENIPTSGSSVASAKDVNFRDYDGTITNSYTKKEFANLTEMPANPSHEGLIAQGWNWTLAKAKAYVAKYGKLNIGQMYITDDGKTRVYIHLEEGRTSPMLGVGVNGTVDVDWGDGTAHDTLTGSNDTIPQYTQNHAYAAPGDYVISLTVTGSMDFLTTSNMACLLRYSASNDDRNKLYIGYVKKIEIGNYVTSIGSNAFNSCSNLTNVTIPDGVTNIGNSAFYNCRNLTSITIPDSVTNIGNTVFYACRNLTSITIPDSVTNINSSVFYACNNLASITIPDSVTSIGNSMFYDCNSLTRIIIPDSVTSIGSNAFSVWYGAAEIHLISTTPPTAGKSMFSSTPDDMIIYVPYSSDHSILDAYKAATNWSTYASKMQEEPI